MVFKGQDAWRRHPLFTNLWRDPFPGIRPAIVIFGLYVGIEYAVKRITTPTPIPRFKAKEITADGHDHGHH